MCDSHKPINVGRLRIQYNYTTILATSNNSVLVMIQNRPLWFPKKCITITSDKYTITMPLWLATARGLAKVKDNGRYPTSIWKRIPAAKGRKLFPDTP